MAWRNCAASVVLVNEVDARWPNRDKASDGTIGDAAHASRDSDHNAWVIVNGVGVVRARDIDEDLDGQKADTGKDAGILFEHLLKLAKAGDPRLNGGGYLIYESRIYSEKGNWVSRPYNGPNAHKKHIHISFSRNRSGFDSTAPWGIYPTATQKPKPPTGALMSLSSEEQDELLRLARSNELRLIQIQKILLGDDPDGKGDTQERQLASLKRLEIDVDKLLAEG
jgi:hypothetical protein